MGTPQGEDGASDLRSVHKVARDIGTVMDGYRVIVMKSTVPVGTHKSIREIVGSVTDHPFDVVSNPEFMKEGAAIEDFLKPDRVVIGCEDKRAAEIVKDLYAPFCRSGAPILVMDNASAEMTKYAANALLATKISFMNEIAELCTAAGGDVEHVRLALGADRRIGYQFLYPGLGFGGSCFPKDLRALVKTGEELGTPIRVCVGTASAIQAILKKSESSQRVLEEATEGFQMTILREEDLSDQNLTVEKLTGDASPVIRLVDSMVFTALQRRNVPSRLVVFPDENHWVLKPANSIRWYQEVLDWLSRWSTP